ncbi:TPA: Rha family transcriptional regulator [Salmonella enterica subsp. diarizonae serovar 60-67:z35:-]
MKQLNLTTATSSKPEAEQFDLLALHESNSHISMTSRDIADLVGSRHDSVKRTIERLADSEIIQLPPMVKVENKQSNSPNRFVEVYNFEGDSGKRDSIIVVAQLCPEFTARLVDRWKELESGKTLPYSHQQQSVINPDFIALTRTVTEATASAMMKSAMEITGIQAVVHVRANVTENYSATNSTSDRESFLDDMPLADGAEYIQVTKIAWETTFSDAACRRLIEFANIPVRKLEGVRGLCVHMESFLDALKELIAESTPPTGKLKRWQHPEFGGFALRKKPEEIFGEEK